MGLQQSKFESVKKSTESVDCELMFSNKSAHKQVFIFNELSMNIFPNFVPNKLVTFDNKEAPWMNNCVKSKIKRRNPLYNTNAKNGYKFHDHLHLQEATNLVSEVIAKRKQDYLNNLAIKQPSN